jgi:hypothetical protein
MRTFCYCTPRNSFQHTSCPKLPLAYQDEPDSILSILLILLILSKTSAPRVRTPVRIPAGSRITMHVLHAWIECRDQVEAGVGLENLDSQDVGKDQDVAHPTDSMRHDRCVSTTV